MLSLKSLFGILALGALSATAAPVGNAVEAGTVMARQVASVGACEDIDWKGDCVRFDLRPDACYTVPSEWNDRISSIESVTGDHCIWYQHANCEGQQYENQSDADLADGNGWWNDRISSMRCSYPS